MALQELQIQAALLLGGVVAAVAVLGEERLDPSFIDGRNSRRVTGVPARPDPAPTREGPATRSQSRASTTVRKRLIVTAVALGLTEPQCGCERVLTSG